MRRLFVALATAILFAVLVAPSALASPRVLESDPPDGAEEHKAPDSVTITFDMPLDDTSLIKVVDECGNQVDAKNTTVTLNEMTVDIAKKPSGHYKAFYYANPPAGATGSTNGIIEFHVHMGPSCGDGAAKHHHGGGNEGHEGHEGNEHEGHEGRDNHENHNGTDHSAHSTTGTHTDHSSATDSTHTDHAAGSSNHTHDATSNAEHDKHQGNSNGSKNPQAAPAPRAAPGGSVELTDSQAVLVSIGACLLLGLAGGWLVRTSQSPRRTKSA